MIRFLSKTLVSPRPTQLGQPRMLMGTQANEQAGKKTEDRVTMSRTDGGVVMVTLNRPEKKNALDMVL